MLISRKIPVLTVAVLTLCLAGCVVKSKNPLSDPDQSLPDEKLFGVWVQKKEGDTKIMVIGKTGVSEPKGVPAGIMCGLYSAINKEGVVQTPGHPTFFITSIGDDHYINWFEESALDVSKHKTWDKTAIKEYFLMKYRVSGDKLEIWTGEEKGIAKAVESGKVGGEVKRDRDHPEVVISASLTDTTENLAQYIKNGGGAILFPNESKIVYERLRTP